MADTFEFYVRDSRKITYDLSEQIMQEDTGVTNFRFHIPKTLNNLDVSEWSWWFVFVNAKKEKYSILLELEDDPEEPFDYNVAVYTVGYAMTIKSGSVQFALEAINAGTGGAIDNEWHTLTYETKVKETLQGNQAEYAETESDIISALLEEVRTKMNQVIGGATPTPVASVSAMTDPSKLYLLTTDGEWYYYNSSAWVSGGVYGAGVVDSVPTQGSTNAVSSGGVYSALEDKADKDSTPENVTTEETDADFYLSDANGNVLLELADGHIKTKEFDSSDINTETDATLSVQGKPADAKAVGDAIDVLQDEIDNIEPSGGDSDVDAWSQSTDTDADLHISDTRGNSLVRFSGGQIRTAKFNSDNGIYEQRKAYTNTSGTVTLNKFFPQGSKVALHLTIHEKRNGDIIANSKITYSYTDNAGTVHSIGSEYGYNFLTYVLETDAVSFTASYGTGLNWGENCTLSFKVYSIGDVPRSPHILEVAPSGKEFSSIRSAIEYAKQTADAINRYEIHIYPGTYDILSYFTAEEIAASDFEGLFVTNGISLVGIGQRSEIILTATMDDTQYTTAQRNRVCTLNVHGNVTLKNMTIKSEKIRYAIHDDYQLMIHQEDVHIYEKVTFTAKNNTSGESGEYTFGAGGGNSKVRIFKDCEFLGSMGIHTTSNMVHESTNYLENCRARVMTFTDYDSGVNSYMYLHNCDVSIIKFSQNGTHDQFMFLEGTGVRDVIVDCPAGYVYAFDGVHKVPKASIAAGYAVKNATTLATVQIATSVTDVYGISLGVANGATYVQTEGWINSKTLGLSNLSVGDYLTINSSGKVVSGGTASNAIAQVKLVDYNSVAYAKLSI